MSCYNSQEFVANSIDSILNQTFQDFEFIIWNDGSTDNTEEIVKSFKDRRIRYFHHENTGLGLALRLACEHANSSIIARMDADDISQPNRLEVEYDYLSSHPETVLVSSAVNYLSEEGIVLGRSFPYSNDKIIRNLLYRGMNVIVHPAVMFRKDVYLKSGGYMPLKKAQDLHLFARMLKYGRFANLPSPYLNYRISLNSISTQTDGTPYTTLIRAYLRKMVADESINERDVYIYNLIVAESKAFANKKLSNINNDRYKKSREEKIYDKLKILVGHSKAEYIVCRLKNFIGTLLYK